MANSNEGGSGDTVATRSSSKKTLKNPNPNNPNQKNPKQKTPTNKKEPEAATADESEISISPECETDSLLNSSTDTITNDETHDETLVSAAEAAELSEDLDKSDMEVVEANDKPPKTTTKPKPKTGTTAPEKDDKMGNVVTTLTKNLKDMEKVAKKQETLINNQKKQLSDNCKTIVDQAATINIQKKTIDDQNMKIRDQAARINSLESALIDEKETRRQQEADLTTKNNSLETALMEEKQSCRNQEAETLRLEEKLRVLYSQSKKAIQDQTSTLWVDDTPQIKNRALLIAASNRTRIAPHLKENTPPGWEWDLLEDIYSVSDLAIALANDDIPKEYEAYAVMEGTNDIRKNLNPIACGIQQTENIKKVQEMAPNAIVIPAEIPPQTNNKNDAVATFNITLEQELKPEGFSIIPTESILGDTKKTIDPHDGYHITNEGGRIMAAALNKLLASGVRPDTLPPKKEKANPATQSNQKTPVETIEIPKEALGKVIGKQGSNIRRLQNTYAGVVELNNKAQPALFSTNNPEAMKDVERTIKKHEEDKENKRRLTQNNPNDFCVHHDKGYCKFGDKCRKPHRTSEPEPKKMKTTPASSYQR